MQRRTASIESVTESPEEAAFEKDEIALRCQDALIIVTNVGKLVVFEYSLFEGFHLLHERRY